MHRHARGDWNVSPLRFRLGERTCPADHHALLVETRPQDHRQHDDGVLVVAHVPCDNTIDELVDACGHAVLTVAAMMNKKFGSTGWWLAGICAPDWLLADLDRRGMLPRP